MYYKFTDAIEVNPKEKLKRGNVAKKVSMKDLSENDRTIRSYSVDQYKGGSKFRNGDTLFARITPCLENGKIAQVNILGDNELAFGSTEFIVFRAIEGFTIPDYVYYLVNSDYIKDPAIKSMTGTSGRQRVQNKIFDEMYVYFPKLETQYRITSILNNLENKINLNYKIIKKLESQAQAIFKSWFVDFEPFQDGNFVESELGLIPEGWEVGKLGKSKLGKVISSGVNEFEGEKIYLATADVSDTNIDNASTKATFDDRPSRANMQPIPYSVWFAKMKDSRKLIFVDSSDYEIIDNMIFSTGFAGIKADEKSFGYLWSYLLTNQFDKIKNSYAMGTTMQAINNTNIKNIKNVIPPESILEDFSEITMPMIKMVSNLRAQNRYLAQTRDTLLPKLMSGEIDVSNIKIDEDVDYD